jgi:hypothetical protein
MDVVEMIGKLNIGIVDPVGHGSQFLRPGLDLRKRINILGRFLFSYAKNNQPKSESLCLHIISDIKEPVRLFV